MPFPWPSVSAGGQSVCQRVRLGEWHAQHARPALTGPLQLTWFDRAGKILGALGEGEWTPICPLARRTPGRLALRSGSPENLDIWTIDIARNLRNRVTSDPQPEGWPVWSPDGTRIVFGSGSSIRGLPEKAHLVQTLVNGTGANETLLEPRTHRYGHVARDNASHADRLVRRRTLRVTRSSVRFRRQRISGLFRSSGSANRFQ